MCPLCPTAKALIAAVVRLPALDVDVSTGGCAPYSDEIAARAALSR